MTITYRSPSCGELVADFKDVFLFLDTTSLISASKYVDFANLLVELSDNGCQLFTLPSAVYEFTRMARNETILDKYEKLVDKLGITIYPRLETKMDTPAIKRYLMLYNDCVNKGGSQRKAPSFTDSLFCVLLYLYRNSNNKVKFMTANYTDIPMQFFDREEMITIDAGVGIQVECIYAFNETKYERIYNSFFR